MFKNYLKATWRNLIKNKTYSILNITGLAIGVACAALIFLWVEDELTYNHQFERRDRIYKVMENQTYDGQVMTFGSTPGPLAAAIKTDIPGIKNSARITWGERALFTLGDKSIYEQGNYADSSYLDMYTLPFIKGSSATAFADIHSIVVTEKMANKFFGSASEAMGKNLKMNNQQEYTVTGVIQDLPKNISLRFEWLVSFRVYEERNAWLTNWGSNSLQTMVELAPNANLAAINKQLSGFIKAKMNNETTTQPFLFAMNDWRLYSKFENGHQVGGRIKYVKLFSIIAWIILIIACINFMNLATARSEKRAREVGVRKVLGAGKQMLIAQFIGEALVMALLSVVLAVLLVYLALPAFSKMVDKELTMQLFKPLHFGSLLAIGLVCGLFAGSYPAFYLSSFNPVAVLKGLKLKTGVKAIVFRKGLVIFQFAISIVLIICTTVIYQQIQHVKSRNLGYDKDHLLITPGYKSLVDHFPAVKSQLQQTGVVDNAALSDQYILNIGSNTGDFKWQGKDPNKQILIQLVNSGAGLFNTMGMKMKEGRDFYDASTVDSNNVVINEKLASLMGKSGGIGQIINRGDRQLRIVGIVKNFVYNDMYAEPEPVIFFYAPANTYNIFIKLKPTSDLPGAMAKVETVIKANNPAYPFESNFVDEYFDSFFKSELLIGKLAAVFAALAIFISCLGLFGLAAFSAEQRKKEIGIRKVLGASTSGITNLLSKEFLQLVGLACIISFPLAWWLMKNWLNDYTYRTSIHWWVFAVAGVVSMLIAVLTVSFQAVKAALANPVKSLRTE
ncbi:MAG: ABC transporter permease [Filimonas sp.]|nr:ABC transporter permease [Filimonas sp.]